MDYKPKKTMCGKCGVNPRRPGQGYCAVCHCVAALEARKADRLLSGMMKAALRKAGYDLVQMRRDALAEVRRQAAESAGFAEMRTQPAAVVTDAAVWQ